MKTLREAIEAAWCRETSACPDLWTPDNPARGQCAVTALVVQDYLGGDLQRGHVNGESHYWNRVFWGVSLDWTAQQFPRLGGLSGAEYRDRSYVLRFPETARRYELLRKAVALELAT